MIGVDSSQPRSRSHHCRGVRMASGALLRSVRRSRSPVTRMSASPARADAKTQASSGSRTSTGAGAAGSGTTTCSRSSDSAESTANAGASMRVRSTRRSSRRLNSPVTRVWSRRTTRRTSAQRPRVVKALTSTLVSSVRRKTEHPHETCSKTSSSVRYPRASANGIKRARIASKRRTANCRRSASRTTSDRVMPSSLVTSSSWRSRSGWSRIVTVAM